MNWDAGSARAPRDDRAPTDPRSQGEEYVVGWYFCVAPGDGKHEYSDGGEVSHKSREKVVFECCKEGWVGVGKRGPVSGGVHGDVDLCTATARMA